MRLHEELFRGVDALTSARYTVTVNGGGYFQGVKAVGDFSPERIVICFPKDEVEAVGRGLSIKKYCDGDLELSGCLLSVRVLIPDGEEPAKNGRK